MSITGLSVCCLLAGICEGVFYHVLWHDTVSVVNNKLISSGDVSLNRRHH